MVAYYFDATKGETPGSLAQKRAVAKALLQSQRAPQNVGEGISALGDGIVARVLSDRADAAEQAGMASANDAFAPIIAALGGGEFPAAPAAPSAPREPSVSTMDPLQTEAATGVIPGNDLPSGIRATAQSLGIDPVDLATAISYETGGTFDPTKRGPTTQWGQHRGLIQFGEPQAKQYGVNWDDPLGSQLGPDGAVAKYLRDTGVKPGMGLLDIYSAINAGGVGRYDRSDANNGGAPGTVRDKVEKQMAGHRQKALALLGDTGAQPAAAALDNMASGGVQVASLDPVAGVFEAGAEQGIPADNAGLRALAKLKAQQDGPSIASNVRRVLNGDPAPGGAEIGMDEIRRMAANRPTDAVAYSGPGATISPEDMQNNAYSALDRELGIQRTPPIAPAPERRPLARVAQALTGAQTDALPEMAGNGGGAAMPSIAQLLAAGSNPFMPEGNQKIINMLMEQELQKRDPSYQMGLEKSRIELDNLRNPRMSPYEEQQIRLNQQDNVRDDRRLGLDERKFDFERDSAGLTDDLKEYDRYAAQETAAGRQPLGVLDFMLRMKQAGASSTNVTVGEGDKFYENLDKKNAETFAALSEAGVNGAAKLAQIDRLEGLLATAPQGGAAMLKQFAGEYGINTEGLDDIQAAQALINELVPQQRQPGSGPMSDADLALFKQSLPRVINQPGGNKLIVDTMRGITQYQVQMGRIADAVADREITPAEARKAIRSLPNPLGNFKVPANTTAPSAMPDVGKMSDDELRAIINGK